MLGVVLVISATWTMDSNFPSAAKPVLVDVGIGKKAVTDGRMAMASGGAVAAAIGAEILYFRESSGHIGWIGTLTGTSHHYTKLPLLNRGALGG